MDKLRISVREFFVKHDRVPEFVFVGLDMFENIVQWHVTERRFYNQINDNTVVGKRSGIEADVNGLRVKVFPSGKLKGMDIARPEQFLL